MSVRQQAFYPAVFRWEIEGDAICFAGAPVARWALPVATRGWLTVLGSDSLTEDLSRVAEAGGALVEGPIDEPGAQTAVIRDKAGAMLALRAGGELPAMSRTDGHFAWTQLNAHDPREAASFYAAVCGWATQPAENGTFAYQDFHDSGSAVAGLMAIDEISGLGVPVMWQAYVRVGDVDTVVELVEREGGRIWVRPTTILPGRFAVCADPDGDVFSVESSP